jgi:hypothetical protein
MSITSDDDSNSTAESDSESDLEHDCNGDIQKEDDVNSRHGINSVCDVHM